MLIKKKFVIPIIVFADLPMNCLKFLAHNKLMVTGTGNGT